MTTNRPGDQPPPDSEAGLGLRDVAGLGSLLVGAVVIGTAMGWLLDEWLDASPVLTLIGLAIGISGGVGGCWLQVRRYLA